MSDVLLQLSAGQGPRECEWVVARLVEAFAREASVAGVECVPIEPIDGPCAAAVLRVRGSGAERFAEARIGTIRWVGTSPFRPLHKRRNWFVGVRRLHEPKDCEVLRDADIRYETLRASGPGGQHVNKTESAVRATHLLTGLTTVSQEQRSQHANRRIARLKLWLMLERRREASAVHGKRVTWEYHQALERGNAVRTYAGPKFRCENASPVSA